MTIDEIKDDVRFFKIPILFFKLYVDCLSIEEIFLYCLLRDRLELSKKNKAQFSDKHGNLYVIFTIKEVCNIFNCGHDKATKLFRDLEKYGLILRCNQGKGKSSIIYVHDYYYW